MQTLRDIAPYVALAAAALALILLVLTVVLWLGVRKLRRAQAVVLGHHETRDIVAQAADLDGQVRNLREAVEILTDQLDGHKRTLDHTLTHRSIVRYDAFRDAGGEQSASFALLDDHRSGVVFSAIAARDFARIYVKYLVEGVADRDLSPEEERAVAEAVPRPLKPGEHGPRSARAPLPPERPPAGLEDFAAPRPGEHHAAPADRHSAPQPPAGERTEPMRIDPAAPPQPRRSAGEKTEPMRIDPSALPPQDAPWPKDTGTTGD